MKITNHAYLIGACILAILLVALAGCSTQSQQRTQTWSLATLSESGDCAALLSELTQQIDNLGIEDPLAYPIKEYPYLRVNRLLESFTHQLETEAQSQAWYQQLYRLGQQARGFELNNLFPAVPLATRSQIEHCIERQAATDRQKADFFDQLRDGAQVPELYSDWQQRLGLFPLTRKIVLHQIANHQQRWRQDFNNPALFEGPSQQYRPPTSPALPQSKIAMWLTQARSRSPLGIPELDDNRLQALFAEFAPVWQTFTNTSADLIGSPYWREERPNINSQDPTTYLLPSYTRFNGQVLLQLNYMIWFAERPPQHPLDLYAGRLDGLIWRVTLDTEGRVLLYDSIHPCGCYHQIFPVATQLRPTPLAATIEQPLLLVNTAPAREQGRVVLQLTPGDHYLQGIKIATAEQLHPTTLNEDIAPKEYRFSSYHQLRSLSQNSGYRNLFDPDGLIGSSARLERFLLWPMGVTSPGAMRVWGAHAIGFANRRHFDDPYLFEQFFE